MKKNNLFVGFVIKKEENSFEVYLINPTNTSYSRVHLLTGGYCGVEDRLIQTKQVVREEGNLLPQKSLLIDKSDLGELDFTIWYHLDLYKEGEQEPIKVRFELPRYHWDIEDVLLPILNVAGKKIELDPRRN